MTKKEFKKKFYGAVFNGDVMRQYYTRDQMAEIRDWLFENQTFLAYQGAFINCWLRVHPAYQKDGYRGHLVMDDGTRIEISTKDCGGYPASEPIWFGEVKYRMVEKIGYRFKGFGRWLKVPVLRVDELIDVHKGLEKKLSPVPTYGFDARYEQKRNWDGAMSKPWFVI